MQYSNPTVDSLLKISYSSSHIYERLRNYVIMEGLLIEDAPMVPLINNLEYILYRKNLEGISINRLGIVSLELSKIHINQGASKNFISHVVYEPQQH
jgi:ABC-type transport system substrate-binding protein